jgi:hypothetical protein
MTLIVIGCLKSADINNDFWYQLTTVDTKKISFFVSYKWYRSVGLIPKIAYQSILQTYFVVVIPCFRIIPCYLIMRWIRQIVLGTQGVSILLMTIDLITNSALRS